MLTVTEMIDRCDGLPSKISQKFTVKTVPCPNFNLFILFLSFFCFIFKVFTFLACSYQSELNKLDLPF